MSSAHRRTLPSRPDLEQQRKLAKELLRAFNAGDHEATARVRAELPDKKAIALADAQFVVAREYGFASWGDLKKRIESLEVERMPPREQFKRAVSHGDAASARQLLSQHRDVRSSINDTVFSFGTTALLSAGNDLDLVGVLLEFGADPNKKSDWWAGGFHPLYGARGEVADRLLAAGSIPDACAAANLDRRDVLARLISEDPKRVHERGGDGKTPLHFARSRSVADFLLEHGADIDARDVDHRSTAAEWMIGDDPADQRIDLARYLVERGASADIFLVAALGLAERARRMLEADPKLLRLRTSQGEYREKPPSSFHIYQWTIGPNRSPLQVAARFGQDETVRVMQQFATPSERLLLACHLGHRDEAVAIVRDNPGIVERFGPVERRALTDEAWAPNPPAVELMLELGFDPAAQSVTGPTGGNALHCAAWEGSVAAVEAILRYPAGRALLESRDGTYNGTPLSWCCHGSVNCGNPKADHAEVARRLVAAGARIDPRMEGCSEAMQAVLEAAKAAP
ncbi:MAG: ankyrin repeat domain-containing protein [Gemmatimonadaceae bacterium]